MGTLKTGTTIAGQTAWHAGNDGPGTGCDADLVDGLHANQLRVAQVATSAPTVKGTGDLWTGAGAISTHDDAWIYPTLTAPWANYGGGWPSARYRKTIDGLLLLQGMVSGGTSGSLIFTLPVGYRPEYSQLMAALAWDCLVNRLNIYNDGRVVPEWYQGNGTTWFSLDVQIWVGG
jgi:hypothetical protein